MLWSVVDCVGWSPQPKWWITVSDADGLESVVRKKKKKTRFILLNVVVKYIICYQYGSSSMQGKGVDI